jgi:hypothetical protein
MLRLSTLLVGRAAGPRRAPAGLRHAHRFLAPAADFPARHIGPREHEQTEMLDYIGYRVSFFFFQTSPIFHNYYSFNAL